MPLRINLFYEHQKQEQARQRDPTKLGALGAVILVLLLVCYYGYRQSAVSMAVNKASRLRADWAKTEPELKAAATREQDLLAQQKVNQALIERIQGRFYWAPFLERFGTAVPANVQILSLAGDWPARGRPVNVLLSGIAAGMQARTVAEDFRISLQQKLSKDYGEVTSTFDTNSLEDGAAPVTVNGQSLPTALFRIRLQFSPTPPVTATPTPSPAANSAAPVRRRH